MAISAISPQGEPGKRPPVASRRTSFSPVAKVAILGFGTVGKAVADLLCNTPNLGIRLTHVFNRGVERKRESWVPKSVEWTDDLQQILASDVDVVVEVAGGLEPAKQWVQRALLAGKSVVTANKHLMAVHGLELLELAGQTGQYILYGASVAGGVPVLNALEHGLAGDTLVKVAGVLNGTCNYILSNMESRGTSLASALEKVQKLGYAEADPSDDLNGLDASCKLAIIARLGFRSDIRPQAIFRRTIESVEPRDFEYARELGCTIRQVSMAEIKGKSLLAAVQPMLVPFSSPLSRTKGSQNALVVTGRHGGETVFSGRGAGGGPTAVAILSDLLALRRKFATSLGGERLQARRVSGNFSFRHVLRFGTPKRSGLFPAIIEALSRIGVEVESELREPKRFKAQSFLTVLVKSCQASAIEHAIRDIAERRRLPNTAVYLPIFPA